MRVMDIPIAGSNGWHKSGMHDRLESWSITSVAAALIVYGLSRRSRGGMFLAAAAVPLAFRGVRGRWPVPGARRRSTDTREALGGSRGVHVRETIRLEKPLADVYRFWRRLENLPRFMANLELVSDLGNGRSHWVAKGPAGVPLEWDAEIINEVENRVIGWRSLPGADIVTAGSVTFEALGDGKITEVCVHLQYSPPAGKAGAFIASLAGAEPSQTIREDLHRLKRLLESVDGASARSAIEPAVH